MSALTLSRRRVVADVSALVTAANRRHQSSAGGRQNQSTTRPSATKTVAVTVAAAVGATVLGYAWLKSDRRAVAPTATVHAFTPKKWKDDTEKAVRLTPRERRFIKFASVEYDGQLYMTPQDFLDSVVEQDARRRLQ